MASKSKGITIKDATPAPKSILKETTKSGSANTIRITKSWKSQSNSFSQIMNKVSRDISVDMGKAYNSETKVLDPIKRARLIKKAKKDIKRAINKAKEKIDKNIDNAVRKTVDAQEKKLKKLGITVDNELRNKIIKEQTKAITSKFKGRTYQGRMRVIEKKAIDKVVKQTSGKIRDIKQRQRKLREQLSGNKAGRVVRGGSTVKDLMRVNHGEQGRRMKNAEQNIYKDVGINFVYWRLSGAHKWYGGQEICEVYASQDSIDVISVLGDNGIDANTVDTRGLYLASEVPDQPHPNCMCYLEAADIILPGEKPQLPVNNKGVIGDGEVKGKPFRIKQVQHFAQREIDFANAQVKEKLSKMGDLEIATIKNKIATINGVNKILREDVLSAFSRDTLQGIVKDYEDDLVRLGLLPDISSASKIKINPGKLDIGKSLTKKEIRIISDVPKNIDKLSAAQEGKAVFSKQFPTESFVKWETKVSEIEKIIAKGKGKKVKELVTGWKFEKGELTKIKNNLVSGKDAYIQNRSLFFAKKGNVITEKEIKKIGDDAIALVIVSPKTGQGIEEGQYIFGKDKRFKIIKIETSEETGLTTMFVEEIEEELAEKKAKQGKNRLINIAPLDEE